MITVLVPFRAGQRAEWQADRLENAAAIGVRVRCGDAATVIAFRKDGAKGTASLGGLTLEGNVVVR